MIIDCCRRCFRPRRLPSRTDRLSIVFLRLANGRWLHAVIKSTKSRKAAFLTSFRFTTEDRIPAILSRPGARIIYDRRGE